MTKLYTYLIIFLLISLPVAANGWTVGFLAGSGGLGDESFNDMTYTGLAKAREEYKFNLIFREWEQNVSMDALLIELIEEHADLLVLNGNQFAPLIHNFAPKHPDILFIANDFDGGAYPNVKSIIYNQHEGAFLAGALAGWFTRSGHVGCIGAIDIPVIQAFQTGFTEGVLHAAQDTKITIENISKLPDYSGFNNPKGAYQLAQGQYNRGVDVIFSVAGMSGNGIIQAASDTEKFVIGVDSNQDHMAKGHVLTSVMKRLDIAVYQEAVKSANEAFTPGTMRYGLENHGISLTPMEYTKEIIPAQILKNLEKLEQKIISGEIRITNVLNISN